MPVEREHDVARVLESLQLAGDEVEESIVRDRAADRAAELLLRRRGVLAERISLGPVRLRLT